jgi:hypothetical protein
VAGTAALVLFQGTFVPGDYVDVFRINSQGVVGYWKAGNGGDEAGFDPEAVNDINNTLVSGGIFGDDFTVTSSAASGSMLINFEVPKVGSYSFNEFGIFDADRNLHYYTNTSTIYKPDSVSLVMRYRISKEEIY